VTCFGLGKYLSNIVIISNVEVKRVKGLLLDRSRNESMFPLIDLNEYLSVTMDEHKGSLFDGIDRDTPVN
jgi:hypothetical protein